MGVGEAEQEPRSRRREGGEGSRWRAATAAGESLRGRAEGSELVLALPEAPICTLQRWKREERDGTWNRGAGTVGGGSECAVSHSEVTA